MTKKLKQRLLIITVLFSLSFYFIFLNRINIEAYEAIDDVGKSYTYCFCGFKGYYLLTQSSLLWYTPHHYDMSVIGKIVERKGDNIKYMKTKDYLGEDESPQDIFEIRMKGDRIIVEVRKGRDIELKKVKIKINKLISRQAYQILERS